MTSGSRLVWVCATAACAASLFLGPVLGAQREGGAAPPAGRAAGAAPGGQAGARGGGGRGPAVPAGPTPRLANGKPDLSGHWNNPYTPNMGGRSALDPKTSMPLTFPRQGERLNVAAYPNRTFDLPYTEWGLNQWKGYDPVNKGDYAGNCLPFGVSRNMNSPHGTQILQTNDATAFLFEQNTWHMWVPTSASFKWPEDLPEAWNGVSVGHWDGDTLVVETTKFNGYTRLDTDGHPHSKGLKLTNKFLRTDSQTMQHTVIVEDSRAYTQPWMNVRTWRLKGAQDVLMEYSCEENNIRNIIEGSIKLWTPPEDID